MQCPECQFDSPPQMKFCGQCGGRLPLQCPACGAEVPAGFKFCGECGARLDRPPAATVEAGAPAESRPSPVSGGPPAVTDTVERQRAEEPAATAARSGSDESEEREIKQVTVLACELTGSSAETLDPEKQHAVLSRFRELARDEVQRFGGIIHQFLGRGFIALFGAPVTFEDHPQRGVRSALALKKGLEESAESSGAEHWIVRMGLDTGLVVVGGLGGMAVGEPIDNAERLMRLAEPRDILIGDSTAKLTESEIELVEVASDDAGGGAGKTWRVSGRLPWHGALATHQVRGQSPFVGRRRELAILEELREQASAGHGQLVGIAGDAGSGKSRLLHEFYLRTFPGQQVSYLRGSCLSYGEAVPYLPLVDMISKAAKISEADAPEIVAGKLRTSIESVGTDADETLPFFLRLVGIDEGAEHLEELEPQAIRTRTFAALRRMLLDASQKALVVLEIEDLHWIDDSSEAFLSSLVDVLGAARMLVLVTYRSGYQPRWLERSYTTQMTMRRLAEEESRELLAAATSHLGLPEAFAEEVLEKADGNPFFLEELARSLAEDDRDQKAVPRTLLGILMARIDRLPEDQKRLLKTASVLGREFSLELLAALWDRPQPLEPLLEDLRSREFLYKAPTEDQSVHFFKHALIQEMAYQSLLSDRRRELHLEAAATLETIYADRLEDAYNLLVYHYPRAGEATKTVHYLTEFAATAARDHAHAEAAKALRDALSHAEKLAPEVRESRTAEIVLQLLESLLPLAGFRESLELCERFAEPFEKLDNPSLSAQYWFWLAHTHTYLGDQEATRKCARRAIEIASECGDETTEGKASYVLGRDGFWSGRFADGVRSSQRAVVLLERTGEPWWQGQAHWVAGFNQYVLGEFDRAISSLERACAIGEALDDNRLDASWSLGYFYASLGDWEAGIEHCERGLEGSDDPLNTAVATGFLGYAFLEKGDVQHAVETLRDSVERLWETGMQQLLGWFSTFLGEAHLRAGELAVARETSDRALEISTAAEFHYGVGLARRARGRVALAEGRHEDAADQLTAAAKLFEELPVPFELGRTLFELAELAEAEGDIATASGHLDKSRQLFTDLGVQRYVVRTERRAESLATIADV